MKTTLPAPLLSQLSDVLAARIGLHFPAERWSDLERGISAAAPALGMADAESCAHRLVSAPLTHREIEILASHLTVGETYFFRENRSFEVLEQHILPALLRAREGNERRLRIWSAGCCTGEEAYSIAMLLDRLIPNIDTWNITLLATDINPAFLRKAAEGKYGEWSFRGTPGWIRERYFNKSKDGRFEIHPRIRKMVTFSYLNFADDVYPSLSNNTSAMDIIFCRNVLMYFTTQLAKQVAGNFSRALVDGGWLIVSPTEASNTLFSSFTPVNFPEAVLYQKTADVGAQPLIVGYQAAPLFAIAEAVPPMPPLVSAEPAAANLPAPQARQADARVLPAHMARICANQGRLGEALQWCEQAIAADKLNPAQHYLLATILQEQGQPDIAIQSLMRALYLDPDFVLAHFSLGNLHQSQGRYRQAQRYFANVLALLRKHSQNEILAEADGLTAGRLAEIVTSLLASLPQAEAESA